MPRERCRSLLQECQVGRLVFTSKAMPAVVPVRYRVEGDQVLLRAANGSGWPSHVAGSVVAFEVDAFESSGEFGWSVVVIGRAESDGQDGRDLLSLGLSTALLTGETGALPPPVTG